MIELSPTTAIMAYLSLTLAVLFSIWGYQHYASRKRKVDLFSQRLYICEYCQYAYMDQTAKKVTRCPQCASYNKNQNYPGVMP